MTTPYQRNMRRQATYWPPSDDADGFGRPAFLDPVAVKVRWQDKADIFRDREGRELTSSAVVYIDGPVEAGGFLALGQHPEPDPRQTDAREIGASGTSDNLRGTITLHKAWLK